jgi:pimeloyl-ACP methyl ester carboxylesterase
MNKGHIVFIHGMFVTRDCWKAWDAFFSEKGFTCHTPAWPLKDAAPEALRKKHPDVQGEGKVRLADVIRAHEDLIKTLPAQPILIGHSMGGLIVQLLLAKGTGRCGVAIDSAPPKGVITTKFSFLKANWPVLNPFSSVHTPLLLNKAQFRYLFADHLSGAELDQAYEAVVPQSKHIPRDTLGRIAKIRYREKKQPLLLIAGEQDKIIPSSLNKSNYKKYSGAASRTDFHEFPGRRHNLITDKGWEEIASFAHGWISEVTQ